MFRIRRSKIHFKKGNRIDLLINGETFFPKLIERINSAEHEIFIETFILENDEVGQDLKTALINAAKRGVWVGLTVDGWGSYYLDEDYINALTEAGVILQIYEPQPSWYRGRPIFFRRLHRKLAVIDGRYAFIGGINLSCEHLLKNGPRSKQDYAAELEGPIVRDIRELCKTYVRDASDSNLQSSKKYLEQPCTAGSAEIAFAFRDNYRNRTNIERAYIAAIHQAKHRVWIANAYFFTSYRLSRAIKKACRRGVDVRLVLQGDPDIPFALTVARSSYNRLTSYGVKIFEYKTRPLHAKIAVIDDQWSTIGSSNLDPLALSFNLEANVFVNDEKFNQSLSEQIHLLEQESDLIAQEWVARRSWHLSAKDFFMYHFLRHFPAMGGALPAHTPKIREIKHERDTQPGQPKEYSVQSVFPESKNARRVFHQSDYKPTDDS